MITPAIRHPGLLSVAIKLTLASTFFALASFTANAEDSPVATPSPPDILLGPLFNDVQTAKLFPDQKTFADAVPNSDPLMILADYRMQKNQSGFDLRHFVEVNFTLPKEGEKYVPPAGNHSASILTDCGRYSLAQPPMSKNGTLCCRYQNPM